MRLILTTIILTMLAQPVSAMTNEALYNACKSYADRGFELADVNDVVSVYQDGVCQGYIIASIEQASDVCKTKNYIEESYTDRPDLILGAKTVARFHGTSADLSNLNAVIQLFVNYVAANPTEWKYPPNADKWLTLDFPCDE